MTDRTVFARGRLALSSIAFIFASVAAIIMGFKTYHPMSFTHAGFALAMFIGFFSVFAFIQFHELGFLLATGVAVAGSLLWAFMIPNPMGYAAGSLAIGSVLAGAGAEFEFTYSALESERGKDGRPKSPA